MSKAKQQAIQFVHECERYGFSWVVISDSVVRITKHFNPGNNEQFTYCDMFADSVLSNAPMRGGSVWGTDGGSVGGAIALKSGNFVMNKSGTGVNFLKALRKLQEAK